MGLPTSPHWDRKANEARSLTAPVGPLGLPRPAYAGRSLPNISRSVVEALGVPIGDGPPLAPPLDRELDPFEGRQTEGPVVVLLIDGFGWFPFSGWARRGASPESVWWGEHARPITTVFPTTTVAALTSLSSGTTPAQHGVVAPNLYLPQLDVVVDVLRMSRVDQPGPEELVTPSWSTASVSGSPSLFRRGVTGVALSRHQFQHTGFNRILYEGAEYVGYATASDLAHLLDELLRRTHPPPLTFAYWDELDTVHHLRGPDEVSFDFEVDRVVHLLAHVARRLGPTLARSVTMLVTGDHGQVSVDPARQIRVDLVPAIADEMVRPLAGDRRAGFFTARPGRREALRSALETYLPPGHRIIPMSEASAAGLFGPPPYHPELAERLGDFLALVPVPTGLLSPRLRHGSRSPDFRGSHSGLEPEELVVPLVTGSLHELASADRPPG